MPSEILPFPQFSESILAYCEASDDPMVRTAPQWVSGCLELEQTLPSEYVWRFSGDEAFGRQVAGVRESIDLNRLYWTDHARNVEAYSMMTMWRGAELLKPAIRSLNVGELITPAVLARSLLELSAASLVNANLIDKLLGEITFSKDTVSVSKGFEERVVKMIWGTRLGDPKPPFAQTSCLTPLQKLSKNPQGTALMPHYEYLCEIAHPNVVGNTRFWSHVERVNDDGSESRLLARAADTGHADEIRDHVIWSLAWSAGALRNSFPLMSNALRDLLSKLGKA